MINNEINNKYPFRLTTEQTASAGPPANNHAAEFLQTTNNRSAGALIENQH